MTTALSPAPVIGPVGAGDVAAVARMLARAFLDDPLFRWVSPDDERRRRLLSGCFAAFTEALRHHGESYATSGHRGAALWVPPDRPLVDAAHAEAFGGALERAVSAGRAAGAEQDAARFAEVAGLMEAHHPPGSYAYLYFLGVAPEHRDRGLGSALLTARLERCDREGTWTYLDATSPANRRLYERHGFRAGAPFAPAGGPPVWPMWRGPAGRA